MDYHLVVDGVSKGPYTAEHIENEFKAGRLDQESLCWTEGWTDWKPLGVAFPSFIEQPKTVTTDAAKTTNPHNATNWAKLAVVMLAGLFTSCVISAVMAFGEIFTGYSIYGWLLWAVVPVGAILAGMGGAGGCYYAALWTNYYPRFLFFVGVVFLAVFTLVATHYLVWANLTEEGVALKTIIGFKDYLNVISHDVSLTSKSHSNGVSLGELSVWYYALQIAGFVAGGMMIYVFLSDRPYCAPCSRYRKHQRIAELHEINEQSFENRIRLIINYLQNGSYQEAVSSHPSQKSLEKRGFTSGFRSSITVLNCPKCSGKTYQHRAYKCTRKDEWTMISSVTADYPLKK